MQPSETEQQLAKAFWDVAVDPSELCQLLVGDTERVGYITRERLYRRLMETFSWYQVLEIVPADQIKNMLNENTINRLRDKTLQKRYEILAEILRTTALSDTFVRLFLNEGDDSLKIEFVNDVAYRHGNPVEKALFYKTDTLRNILSNKIGALSRHEAKDVADIIEIAKRLPFNWKEVIAEAKMKDMWVDESEVMRVIKDFPISKLNEVKWIEAYNPVLIKKHIDVMLGDLFTGGDNRLYEDK